MEIPSEVPVMTLRSATLFPQALLPLHIFEPRYRRMLADSLKTNRMFCVAMQKPGRTRETPCPVAGLGLVRVSVDHSDGTSHLVLQGLTRVGLGQAIRGKPYRVHRIRPLQADRDDSVVIDALLAKVHELVRQRMELSPTPYPFPAIKDLGPTNPKIPSAATKVSMNEVLRCLESLGDADQVADLVSCALLPDAGHRQTLMETVPLEPRLKHLIHFLMAEIRRTRKEKVISFEL